MVANLNLREEAGGWRREREAWKLKWNGEEERRRGGKEERGIE